MHERNVVKKGYQRYRAYKSPKQQQMQFGCVKLVRKRKAKNKQQYDKSYGVSKKCYL
jgi:hypothetical protein